MQVITPELSFGTFLILLIGFALTVLAAGWLLGLPKLVRSTERQEMHIRAQTKLLALLAKNNGHSFEKISKILGETMSTDEKSTLLNT